VNGPDVPGTLAITLRYTRLKADDVVAVVQLDAVKKPTGRVTLETGDKTVLADFETSALIGNWTLSYAWTGACAP
jgi:hypothetical protein